MITFVCVWVKGNVPYTPEYVNRLRLMVLSRCAFPHDFVILTDRPEQVTKVPMSRTIEIPPCVGYPGWWAKVQIFNPRHQLRGRGCYLDLDVLLPRNGGLGDVLNFSAPIAFVPHEGNFEGRSNLRVIKKYNSSVIKFDELSAYPGLYTKWNISVTKRLWGDQDWIGEQLPNEATMPLAWFPRISSIDLSLREYGVPASARVILCKRPKNHELAAKHKWVDELWA